MNIDLIRSLTAEKKIRWTTHGLERMQEKDISRREVFDCIFHGEVIEDYPDDYPFPSCLIFYMVNKDKPIHCVIGCDGEKVYIITTYIPNLIKFEPDYKTRRK